MTTGLPPVKKSKPLPPSTKPQEPKKRSIQIKRGRTASAHKIVIYGTGGIGKTTLASMAPEAILIDVEQSAKFVDCPRVDDIQSLYDLRETLLSPEVREFKTIVIDSITKVEELIGQHIADTIPKEKGGKAKSLDDYGFGKGYNHLFEQFLLFLSDLEALERNGNNVILVAHDCSAMVPNPTGDDYIRYEPRLWQAKNGNNSLRDKLKEWTDHLFFIGYDLAVEDRKAKGSGSRTIYTTEQPHCMAKSRTLRDAYVFDEGSDILWTELFGGESA